VALISVTTAATNTSISSTVSQSCHGITGDEVEELIPSQDYYENVQGHAIDAAAGAQVLAEGNYFVRGPFLHTCWPI
jgi:hypothetical protein